MIPWLAIGASAALLCCALQPAVARAGDEAAPVECVVLLHGLGRSARSMTSIETALRAAGYATWKPDYPSTSADVETLAQSVFGRTNNRCAGFDRTHFVTHSLGGILVRQHLESNSLSGRVVMLSPPNHGSEIPDWLQRIPLLGALLGPASLQLGTGANSVPNRLQTPTRHLSQIGIITGNRSSDPWFSGLIPGPDDGKVSVASAELKGAGDFLVVPYGHTFIMRYQPVISQVIRFLQTGRFSPKTSGQ